MPAHTNLHQVPAGVSSLGAWSANPIRIASVEQLCRTKCKPTKNQLARIHKRIHMSHAFRFGSFHSNEFQNEPAAVLIANKRCHTKIHHWLPLMHGHCVLYNNDLLTARKIQNPMHGNRPRVTAHCARKRQHPHRQIYAFKCAMTCTLWLFAAFRSSQCPRACLNSISNLKIPRCCHFNNANQCCHPPRLPRHTATSHA